MKHHKAASLNPPQQCEHLSQCLERLHHKVWHVRISRYFFRFIWTRIYLCTYVPIHAYLCSYSLLNVYTSTNRSHTHLSSSRASFINTIPTPPLPPPPPPPPPSPSITIIVTHIYNIGASKIRIGFWRPLYYIYKKEPPK